MPYPRTSKSITPFLPIIIGVNGPLTSIKEIFRNLYAKNPPACGLNRVLIAPTTHMESLLRSSSFMASFALAAAHNKKGLVMPTELEVLVCFAD